MVIDEKDEKSYTCTYRNNSKLAKYGLFDLVIYLR